MISLIVTLALLLDAVSGAAHPSITPAADLVDRQNPPLSLVWSPYPTDDNVQYTHLSYSGWTITTKASSWVWCGAGRTECPFATLCASGIVHIPGTTSACAGTRTRCGTVYLMSSPDAQSRLTNFGCFDRTDRLSETLFIASPPAAAITTSTPQPGLTTSISSPTQSSFPSTSASPANPNSASPSPSTPVGAIVGGVVGGLAVIAIAAIAICLLLRRRRQEAGGAAPPTDVGQHSFPSTQSPPPTTTSENKHASVMYTQVPGSPPPMYQNQAGQNWNAYPMHGGDQVSEMPSNTAAGLQPGGAGTMRASPQQQEQHKSTNRATFEMPTA